jgi:phage tail sheath protein FI
MNPAAVRATGASITSTNTQGFDLSDASKPGAKAYKMALEALSNPDAFDINLLVMPGVVHSQHPYITTQAIQVCENRGDCFMIVDGDVLGATVTAAVNAVSDLDTSYAAAYHPWVKVRDNASNKTVWVPPSVVMPAVFAFNDRVAAEWFAPAGLNRGGVQEALQVRSRLDQQNRDELYEGRVNPIATFPAQGICVWGQKTLQQAASALDRINVRRLMIKVKKFIASSSRYLVFEQNTEATRNRFLSIVNPYLANVQERSGLYAFKVVMDDSNNTPDLIDRNILVGQIYLQPTRTAEFITLDFNILPTGAVFPS